MRKKTVLCEVAFWKKFSECYPSLMPFPDERAIENLKYWMELYSFLFRSDVHFDCSDKQFIELAEADERLRYLWKKSAGGECGIDFSEESFDSSYLEGSPLSVLFSESDRHIDASRFGIINITADNYSMKGVLFRESGFPLRHNQEWSWEELSKVISKDMSNSLVIVDNYILSTDGQFKRENLDDNIFVILEVLLPESCGMPFDLTVFYSEGNSANEERLRRFIRDIRPNLSVNLKIHKVSKNDFHDRTIISNNFWISAPGGFDLLKKKRFSGYYATKATTVSVWFPYFCSGNIQSADKSYTNLIQDARHALEIRGLAPDNRLLKA